jgi:hypothetical protein
MELTMYWMQSRSKTESGAAGDEGIRANWRAAILSSRGEPQIFGRISRLSLYRVEATIPHGLLPGSHCHLVVMLPRAGQDVARRVIEGRCTVSSSAPAPSGGQFHITLEWLEMLGDGEAILRDCLGKDTSVPMIT